MTTDVPQHHPVSPLCRITPSCDRNVPDIAGHLSVGQNYLPLGITIPVNGLVTHINILLKYLFILLRQVLAVALRILF